MELSNAVTVLIARMESHPEDFNTTGGRVKFRDVADALYGLIGLDKEAAGAYWFLTDTDKEALIEAWKKYHRTAMEKAVMAKIFDDGHAEREAEMERLQMKQQMYQAQQRAMMQNSTVQPWQNAMNAAQNSSGNAGLFGSAGSALQGIFK